jgi:hypothetical protein
MPTEGTLDPAAEVEIRLDRRVGDRTGSRLRSGLDRGGYRRMVCGTDRL